MKILLLGATGATGSQLLPQLLERGHEVRTVVRSLERFPTPLLPHPNLYLTVANVLELSEEEREKLVQDCEAVMSCLGHRISLGGIWGKPRRLVTEVTQRFCEALLKSGSSSRKKFVLMNTVANRNRDLDEQVSLAERLLMGLIRRLVPPQADNEQAADYLRTQIGQGHPDLEWVIVRPDSLIDEAAVSSYALHPSPIRSGMFNPGQTSRINVAHFMAELVSDQSLWKTWQGQMPVIYNEEK